MLVQLSKIYNADGRWVYTAETINKVIYKATVDFDNNDWSALKGMTLNEQFDFVRKFIDEFDNKFREIVRRFASYNSSEVKTEWVDLNHDGEYENIYKILNNTNAEGLNSPYAVLYAMQQEYNKL